MALRARIQTFRSTSKGIRPVSGDSPLPGEVYANYADKQLGIVNSDATANIDLIGVRFFSTAADYVAGDHVVQAGTLYKANGAITAGAFNAANWTAVGPGAGGGVADGDKGDIVVTGSGATWSFDSTVVTAAAKTVLDDTTTTAMRTTLGAAATVHNHSQADITNLVSDLAAKAPLNSPPLTGTPTAPTAGAGTNTTQIATTQFVTAAVAGGGGGGGLPLTGGTLTGNLTISAGTIAGLTLNDTGALSGGNASTFTLQRGGVNRWAVFLDTGESGGNVGSNLRFARYNDAGGFTENAFAIARNDGSANFARDLGVSGTLYAFGALNVTGVAAFSTTANLTTTNIDGPITGTAAATVTLPDVFTSTSGGAVNMVVVSGGRIVKSTSMRAAKTEITPLADAAGDAILALVPSSFRFKDGVVQDVPRVHYGFIAEDLAVAEPHFPSYGVEPERDTEFNVVLDGDGNPVMGAEPVPNGVDILAILAGLVQLVRRMDARIKALEAA